MKKIKTLFERDYDGNRLAIDKITEGSEWVENGDGLPTEKIDGTCCMVKDGVLYKRYERKLKNKRYKKNKSKNKIVKVFKPSDFENAPDGWIATSEYPDSNTGSWPGWLRVDSNNPSDKWHIEAFNKCKNLSNGTYELIGEKVQGNPYNMEGHALVKHGSIKLDNSVVPRDFDGLREYLKRSCMEGIVWHHEDGRMVKVKRKDFGFTWGTQKKEVKNV